MKIFLPLRHLSLVLLLSVFGLTGCIFTDPIATVKQIVLNYITTEIKLQETQTEQLSKIFDSLLASYQPVIVLNREIYDQAQLALRTGDLDTNAVATAVSAKKALEAEIIKQHLGLFDAMLQNLSDQQLQLLQAKHNEAQERKWNPIKRAEEFLLKHAKSKFRLAPDQIRSVQKILASAQQQQDLVVNSNAQINQLVATSIIQRQLDQPALTELVLRKKKQESEVITDNLEATEQVLVSLNSQQRMNILQELHKMRASSIFFRFILGDYNQSKTAQQDGNGEIGKVKQLNGKLGT